MKKVGIVALIGLLLTGCSYTDIMNLLTTPTVPPLPTDTATIYVTPSDTPTITPTLPTPTFTLTPTLIYPNGTPVPTFTVTPLATPYIVASPIATTGPLPMPGIDKGPFASIVVSGSQLKWGGCEPSSVTATVKVSPGIPAAVVTMWLRLQDVSSGETTDWGGGAIMNKQGGGVYTYNLTAENWEHYREFTRAWGQYQFVASDSQLHRLGGSGLYLNSLTISHCP